MYWYRREFKIFENYHFLDWCSNSPAPSQAVKAVQKFLNSTISFPAGSAALQFFEWGKEIEKVKTGIARLLNSTREEVAITGTSTTQGIQTAFEMISPEKDENIVTFDTHWTNELIRSIPEMEKWRRKGVEIRFWKHRNLKYSLDDLDSIVDNKTRIIHLDSSTLFGYRFDLKEIVKVAHEKNALVVADSVQETGALATNIQKLDIDFMAFGGYKYLTTPFGIGILYVNRRIFEQFDPPHYGYNNIIGPEAGWAELFDNPEVSIPDFKLVNDAAKYEYGAFPAYPGIIGLNASVNIINSIGIEKIDNKVRQLKKILMDELENTSCRIISPLEQKNWSPITAFNVGASLKDDYKMVSELRKKKILVSARRVPEGKGAMVVATHYPNTEQDVLNLIKFIKGFKS